MKAYITEKGILRIVGETETERFALNQWCGIAFGAGEREYGHNYISAENMIIGGKFPDLYE